MPPPDSYWESASAPAVSVLALRLSRRLGQTGRELLRLCAWQRAPVDSPSLATAGAAEAVALQIAAELAGAAAKQGALTPKIFMYPEMKVEFTAKV